MGSVSCNALLQSEANNVSASIADYFSLPEHTKTPTINDLVDWGSYIPPEKRKSPRRSYSVKGSDLIVFISGEADDEIEIWVIAGKGQCPAGKAWIINMTWEKESGSKAMKKTDATILPLKFMVLVRKSSISKFQITLQLSLKITKSLNFLYFIIIFDPIHSIIYHSISANSSL